MTTRQYPNIWAAARFYADARYVRRDLNGSCPGESAAARRMYRPSIASRSCPLPAMGTHVRIIERWLQHPIVGGPSCPSTSFLDIGDRWSQFGGWQRLRGATTGCPPPLPPLGIAYVRSSLAPSPLPPQSSLRSALVRGDHYARGCMRSFCGAHRGHGGVRAWWTRGPARYARTYRSFAHSCTFPFPIRQNPSVRMRDRLYEGPSV